MFNYFHNGLALWFHRLGQWVAAKVSRVCACACTCVCVTQSERGSKGCAFEQNTFLNEQKPIGLGLPHACVYWHVVWCGVVAWRVATMARTIC